MHYKAWIAEQASSRNTLSPTAEVLVGLAFIAIGVVYIRFRKEAHEISATLGFAQREVETRGQRVAFAIKYIAIPIVFIVVGLALVVASAASVL